MSSFRQRKIIHIDMDCFYAAIETRDNPFLKGKAVAVGGHLDNRGVLCTANYEARKFGVKAAMPTALALKQCPDLQIVPPNFKKYKEASNIIKEIFKEYTDLIETVSLDEAYLDVSQNSSFSNSATLMAKDIRHKIYKETGLTASAGIAPNKFLAKVASDWRKPNGIFTISPSDVPNFLPLLPLNKINGVGKVTNNKLNSLGLYKCSDIQNFPLDLLEENFGKFASTLKNYSYGIDNRPVITEHIRKSLSVENTFGTDINQKSTCKAMMLDIIGEMCDRIQNFRTKKNEIAKHLFINKAFVKIKYYDFKTITIERSFPRHVFSDLWFHGHINDQLRDIYNTLFDEGLNRRESPIRLLGTGVRFKDPNECQDLVPAQLSLF